MKVLVNALDSLVRRLPWLVIIAALVITFVMGSFAGQFAPADNDNDSFAPDAEELGGLSVGLDQLCFLRPRIVEKLAGRAVVVARVEICLAGEAVVIYGTDEDVIAVDGYRDPEDIDGLTVRGQ